LFFKRGIAVLRGILTYARYSGGSGTVKDPKMLKP
jgi:hypothetical protein